MLMRQFNGKVSSAGLMKLEKIATLRRMEARFLSAAGRCHWHDQPETARWICLCVRTGHESVVAEWLDKRDIEACVPVESGRRINKRRGEVVDYQRVAVPGYVFVRALIGPAAIAGFGGMRRDEGRCEVASSVQGLLRNADGDVHSVSHDKMRKFIGLMDNHEAECEGKECPFSRGDRVEIAVGPFAGLVGFMRQVKPKQARAMIELSGVGDGKKIEFPVATLEKL